MSFIAKPGNIIETQFVGASSRFIPSAGPEAIIARALIFDLREPYAKRIDAISYSLARIPFVAGGVYTTASPWENEVFGRLTVFRNLGAGKLTNLFEPYFDINYTNALPNPNATDYYGERVDYISEDKLFDLLITKVNAEMITLPDIQANSDTSLTIVLTPFYKAIKTGDATPRPFGAYFGDEFARTLSVLGKYCY